MSLKRSVATVDYASPAPVRGGGPRLVIGLLCWSVPPVLALLALLTWMKSGPAVVGVMLLGFYVGLPCVPIGFLILPGAFRGRVVKWAWLPMLVAFGIIFGLGSSAEIA